MEKKKNYNVILYFRRVTHRASARKYLKDIKVNFQSTKYESEKKCNKNTISKANNNCEQTVIIISIYNNNYEQTEGSNVTLECVASGSPEPEVRDDIKL